ncbi:unnamed protein product, partial [Brassica rapa]
IKLKLLNITATAAQRNNGHPSLTTWARLALQQSTGKTEAIGVSLEFLIFGMSFFLCCFLSM